MSFFSVSIVLFLVSYLPLRYVKNLWEQEEAPDWASPAAWVLSWFMVVSIGLLVYGVFRMALGGSIFTLVYIIVGVGLLLYFNNISPDFLDLPHMMPFIKKVLVFDNISGKRINFGEELARLEVLETYKEVTGKEFQQTKKPATKPQQSREELLRELEQIQNRGIASPHLQQELGTLEKNEPTDISDSWKINSIRSSAHAYYSQVRTARINPRDRSISFAMDFGEMDIAPLQQPKGVFVFYREMYEFLQAMNTQDWMKPYLKYVDRILLLATRVETDGFGVTDSVDFFRLTVPVSELRGREGKFFNAAELPAISSVQFQSGRALS